LQTTNNKTEETPTEANPPVVKSFINIIIIK